VRCGVDETALLLVQPASLSHALEALTVLVDTAAVAVLVLDLKQGKQHIDDAALNRLVTALHRSNCLLILVEHGETALFPSKAAVKLQLKRERWLERRRDVTGYRTNVHIVHNKFGPSGVNVSLTIGFSTVVHGDGL